MSLTDTVGVSFSATTGGQIFSSTDGVVHMQSKFMHFIQPLRGLISWELESMQQDDVDTPPTSLLPMLQRVVFFFCRSSVFGIIFGYTELGRLPRLSIDSSAPTLRFYDIVGHRRCFF